MFVPLCDRFYLKQANIGKITIFGKYPSLTPACASFLELKESGFGLLRFMFKVENFMCTLS